MPLIKQLIDKGIIDKEKAVALEFEAQQSCKKQEELLIEKGIISEEVLFSLKSESLKIPLKSISPDHAILKVLELVPEETARYYQMIPLEKTDDFLEIGMVYPEDLKAQEALNFLARQGKFNPKIYLITPNDFKILLKQYRTLKREVGMALDELETELKQEQIKKKPKTMEDFERMATEAPITKMVAVILRHAVEGLASDIHIEPTREKLRVRFRLMGTLHSSIFLPLKVHPAIVARIKIISNLKIDETRIPQDGRFSTKIGEKSIDFRVSTFPTSLGEKVAIRVLDPETGLRTFEDLGLDGKSLKVLKSAILKPYGLILATGPTGSGKTTTLYAILQLLNKESINIVTLEDPIEYFVEGVNQSQINPEIGYDFPIGLRQILRQDPNVIMVGEIRDEETASLAIHAALTGHIVLSTLHTSNASGVIPRLIDMGVKPYLIPPVLQCALAQRLVRKLCDDCKKEIKIKPEIREMILKEIEEMPLSAKKEIGPLKSIKIYAPIGCQKCFNSGYSGRISLFEILSMTDSLAELMIKNPSEVAIRKEAKSQGMLTMKQDGILKALNGITTIEEVLRVAEDK